MRTLNTAHNNSRSTTSWLKASRFSWVTMNNHLEQSGEYPPDEFPTQETKCGKCGEQILAHSDQAKPGDPVAVYVDCYYQFYHASPQVNCCPCLDCCLSFGDEYTVFTVRKDG